MLGCKYSIFFRDFISAGTLRIAGQPVGQTVDQTAGQTRLSVDLCLVPVCAQMNKSGRGSIYE